MPASLTFDDLTPVPVEVLWLRPPVWMLHVPYRLAVVGHQGFLKACGAVGLVGDQQDALTDGESPEVKRLVVQKTEDQAIILGFGAARLVPVDMSGIQAIETEPRRTSKPQTAHLNSKFYSRSKKLPDLAI